MTLLAIALLGLQSAGVTPPSIPCPLSTAQPGIEVALVGRIVANGHDVWMRPSGCGEIAVVCWWVGGGCRDIGSTARKDRQLKELSRILFSKHPSRLGAVVNLRATMEVAEDFEPDLGKRPPMARVPGKGFGTPISYARYRVTISAVETVRRATKEDLVLDKNSPKP